MTQRTMKLALLGMVAAALTACSDPTGIFSSGDPNEAYCAALNQDRAKLADMTSSGSPTALIDALPTLRSLGKQAPADIAQHWQTLINAVDGLNKALASAGVSASDFAAKRDSLSDAQKEAIATAANALSSADTTAATTAIDQQARDVCKTNIGM